MSHAKIAFAAGVMAVSLLGGVALGGYTTGGVDPREPIDVIGNAAASVRHEDLSALAPAEPAPVMQHVCKGCDAKLYREDAWYRPEGAYDTDAEWAREEAENRELVHAATAGATDWQGHDEVVDIEEDVPPDQRLEIPGGTVVARLDD